MKNNNTRELFHKLNKFVQKYYLNKLIKGVIYCFSIMIVFFILFSVIEHFTRLDVRYRTILFWSYIIITLSLFIRLIVFPILQLFSFGKIISHKKAAKIIGLHFSDVSDKLINLLELSEMKKQDRALIEASIEQKTKLISPVPFNNAIDLYKNKKHTKGLTISLLIVLLLFVSGKQYILTESSARIIKHNTFFEPTAPFLFVFENDLETIQYEDWLLDLSLVGKEIPSSVFIEINGVSFKLKKIGENNFHYLLKSVTKNTSFYLLAGGYRSKKYTLKALAMPKVIDFSLFLDYPKHTSISDKKIKNNGDVEVPEGTKITWNVNVKNTNVISFLFPKETVTKKIEESFYYKKQVRADMPYQIITKNEHALSDSLSYYISVVPDEFPKITIEQNYDSITALYLFSGEISDDYLLSRLTFNYKFVSSDSAHLISKEISLEGLSKEVFFYSFDFNSLALIPGDEIIYYFSVWDNDGLNGPKRTDSHSFLYKEMTSQELINKKEDENKKTKDGLSSSLGLAEEIKKDLSALQKSILEKKELSWEEKMKLQSILKKQKELEQQIQETQKENNQNSKTQKKLNSSTLEKQKKLDDLINNLLDENLKKTLEELEKTMNNIDKEKLKQLLERLNEENSLLEKELNRDLELFKQLEIEQNIEELIKNINELKNSQEDLIIETEKKDFDNNTLSKKQDSLTDKMKKIEEKLEDLRKKNLALEDKHNLPKTKSLEEKIKKEMENSSNELKNKKTKQSKKSQQNAVEDMQKLQDLIENMQAQEGEEKYIEDIETLRKILENLITLSFDQEGLISSVENTPRNSPQFVPIIQNQNKLTSNCKIIEDSLFALSKRVVEIQATINKEISLIKNNMKKATTELEKRNINKVVEHQQFVMTSSNNLALILSEILEQMQKDLDSNPSKCNKPRNCNNPKNCNKPSLSELNDAQKKLNNTLKKTGKGKNAKNDAQGLMRLAKTQEEIRRQLEDLKNELINSGEKSGVEKILQEMEETETDIVNNKITQETIIRQQDILTRLLEEEKAIRERDTDSMRESSEYEKTIENTNQQYLEYIKKKKAHEELLKTKPIQLTPYYKKKVDLYFNSLIQE